VRKLINPRQGDITPWDAGGVQPPLRDLLLSDQLDWPRKGRALVPGCGRVKPLSLYQDYLLYQ
jgi:hypothetical protein